MMKYFLLVAVVASAAVAKPYPQDMRRSFMQSCAGLSKELVTPCRCVLNGIEASIPKDQFEKLLASGKAESDPRIASVARKCNEQR